MFLRYFSNLGSGADVSEDGKCEDVHFLEDVHEAESLDSVSENKSCESVVDLMVHEDDKESRFKKLTYKLILKSFLYIYSIVFCFLVVLVLLISNGRSLHYETHKVYLDLVSFVFFLLGATILWIYTFYCVTCIEFVFNADLAILIVVKKGVIFTSGLEFDLKLTSFHYYRTHYNKNKSWLQLVVKEGGFFYQLFSWKARGIQKRIFFDFMARLIDCKSKMDLIGFEKLSHDRIIEIVSKKEFVLIRPFDNMLKSFAINVKKNANLKEKSLEENFYCKKVECFGVSLIKETVCAEDILLVDYDRFFKHFNFYKKAGFVPQEKIAKIWNRKFPGIPNFTLFKEDLGEETLNWIEERFLTLLSDDQSSSLLNVIRTVVANLLDFQKFHNSSVSIGSMECVPGGVHEVRRPMRLLLKCGLAVEVAPECVVSLDPNDHVIADGGVIYALVGGETWNSELERGAVARDDHWLWMAENAPVLNRFEWIEKLFGLFLHEFESPSATPLLRQRIRSMAGRWYYIATQIEFEGPEDEVGMPQQDPDSFLRRAVQMGMKVSVAVGDEEQMADGNRGLEFRRNILDAVERLKCYLPGTDELPWLQWVLAMMSISRDDPIRSAWYPWGIPPLKALREMAEDSSSHDDLQRHYASQLLDYLNENVENFSSH